MLRLSFEIGHLNWTIDAIGYSRGGLVLRHFMEKEFPQHGFTRGKAVFVGATLAGTELARPENLSRFLDIHTTLISNGAGLIASTFGDVGGVKAAIKQFGEFVKVAATLGLDKGVVPGLASMTPGSGATTDFDYPQNPNFKYGDYHTISSNYSVNKAPCMERTQALILKMMVSNLYQTKTHDLVVDTPSMKTLHFKNGKTHSLNTHPSEVHHLNYFGDNLIQQYLATQLYSASLFAKCRLLDIGAKRMARRKKIKL